MKKDRLKELKGELLERTLMCEDEELDKAKTIKELIDIVKFGFPIACVTGLIDEGLIASFKKEFDANEIYCNEDASKGFLLVTSGEHEAKGEVKAVVIGGTLIALDNVLVNSYDNSNVMAFDKVKVMAHGYSKTSLWGEAEAESFGMAVVEAYEASKVCGNGNSIIVPHNNNKVVANDDTIVRISKGKGKVSKVKLKDRAMLINETKNEIITANKALKVKYK